MLLQIIAHMTLGISIRCGSRKRKRTPSEKARIRKCIEVKERAPKHPRLHGALVNGDTIYTLHSIGSSNEEENEIKTSPFGCNADSESSDPEFSLSSELHFDFTSSEIFEDELVE